MFGKSITAARYELRTLFASRYLRAALTVIGLVPLLYGALYLWAFWDPYAHIDQLPVAVVNEDGGEFGTRLTETLKNTPALGWRFISRTEAESGLSDRRYYAAIIIPSDFSQRIASVENATPEQAGIEYASRQANGFITSQITNRVVSEIVSQMNVEVTKGYYAAIFSHTHDSALTLDTAARGAQDLAAGVETARTGAGQLADGASRVSTGSAELSTGMEQILSGSRTLTASLQSASAGMDTLYTGMRSSDQAVAQLRSGSIRLNTGIVSLQNGVSEAADSSSTLAVGAQHVSDGVTSLETNLGSIAQGFQSTQESLVSSRAAASRARSAFALFRESHPECSADPDCQSAYENVVETSTSLDMLSPAQSALNQNLSAAVHAVEPIRQGAGQVSSGATALLSGLQAAKAGFVPLTNGSNDLTGALTQLQNGSTALLTGTRTMNGSLGQLSRGSETLSQKLDEAHVGSVSLQGGTHAIFQGAQALQSGFSSATEGSRTLATALSKGAQESLSASDPDTVNRKLSVLSNPVALQDISTGTTPNYGTGLAPYFIPISLWVGTLLMFFVVSMDELKEATEASHRVKAMGKFLLLGGIGIAQAVILGLVVKHGLGLYTPHPVLFYAFLLLISLTFVAILQLFVGFLGDIGRFIGIVFLMLQITSSAGTFPIETAPRFFQDIHAFLPMTYAVTGLREIVTGGNMTTVAQCSGVLIGVFILFLGLFLGIGRMIECRRAANVSAILVS